MGKETIFQIGMRSDERKEKGDVGRDSPSNDVSYCVRRLRHPVVNRVQSDGVRVDRRL